MASTSQPVLLSNRCNGSKSPYVRHHANDPTAWQLWGPDSLELAKTSNRLLLLSIGYSACYWCHVMQAESFQDAGVAKLLNEKFIPIKVDREERPDIDRQYMDFLQATTGGGGWPLNVFVTPDLQPIFGGTYWPGPKSERLRPGAGFEDILKKVAEAWDEQEESIRNSGKKIAAQLRDFAAEGSLGGRQAGDGIGEGEEDNLELDLLEESYQHYKPRFDEESGGFGGAPKFPTPTHLGQLLRLGSFGAEVTEVVGDDEVADARRMALKTLEAMFKGGIKDQIGHGLSRYSVNREWGLPHFEKMLYDNAQLLPLYVDAWRITQKPLFLEAVNDIATYLSSPPMVSELGGIHASEDADSLISNDSHEKREGAFYVYMYEELKAVLSSEELEICMPYWGIKQEGNIDQRYDAEGELKGQNTLCVQLEISELAGKLNVAGKLVQARIDSARKKLLDYRDRTRPRPALDDKIATAWNGLAVSGLAKASTALHSTSPEASSTYLTTAINAASCIKTHLYDSSAHTLRRVYREGPGDIHGFADDYAFLVAGLLDLYEATFDSNWLAWADELQQSQIKQFWDPARHAFFSTPEHQADILVRTKDGMDNAEPSVNGVSASNLFRLGSMLNDAKYEKLSRQTVAAFEVEIGQHPGLFSGMMSSIVAAKLGCRGLMVVGVGEEAEAAVRKYREGVFPTMTMIRVGNGAEDGWLKGRNDLLADTDGDREMVQLCEGGVCKLLDATSIETLS
nr:hypothetical protein B0A51_02712 [Rachicladosporium sp. CCFEE 5018]